MDRFLLLRNHFTDSKNKIDLASRIFEGHSADAVAITCLLLASKFDEIDDNIPLIEEFCKGHSLVRDSLDSGFLLAQGDRPRLTQCRTYPGMHTVQECELYMLRILCWDLNTVTPLHFVLNHLFQGVVFSNDMPVKASDGKLSSQLPVSDKKVLQKMRRHVDYFAL